MFPLIETQYFPSVPFFAHLQKSGKVYLEAHENYVKRSYRNRCHIASANGVERLSIPLLKGKNEGQCIRSVRISYSQPWQAKHWHAIRSAYGNSPFFEHYADEVAVFFKDNKPEYLWDFNLGIIKAMLGLMEIKTELHLTTEYHKTAPENMLDLRNKISPKTMAPASVFQPVRYPQVFEERHGFLPGLSILDLLFCAGPAAKRYAGTPVPAR